MDISLNVQIAFEAICFSKKLKKPENMRITVKAHCDKHQKRKDGKSTLYLKVTIDRRVRLISLSKHISFENWDDVTKRIKNLKAEPMAKAINRFLTEEERKLEQIVLEIQSQDGLVTFEKLKKFYSGNSNEYFENYVEEIIELDRNRLKEVTIKNFRWRFTKVYKYHPNLKLKHITKDWLERFRNHLIEDLKLKPNTVHGDLAAIRKFVRRAYKEKLIKHYPFEDFEFSRQEVDKEYLTMDELDKLHAYYDSKKFLDIWKKDKRGKSYHIGKKYQDLTQQFLIACYTGLRLSDVRKLRYGHIHENMIIMKMQKGRLTKEKTIRIPLRGRQLSVLDLEGKTKNADMVYGGFVRNNSDTNYWLKDIMKEVGIDKYITFHCSRHTFAINSLVLGIPIETVSDLLGHNDLRTTQIYAKIVDEKRHQGMDHWDKVAMRKVV